MVLQGVGSSLLTHGIPTSGFRRLLWLSDESSERSNTETSMARKISPEFHDGDHHSSFGTRRRLGTTLVWSTRLTWCRSICCLVGLMDASRIRHLSLVIPSDSPFYIYGRSRYGQDILYFHDISRVLLGVSQLLPSMFYSLAAK